MADLCRLSDIYKCNNTTLSRAFLEKKMNISSDRRLIFRSFSDFGYIMLKNKVGQC